MEETYFRERKQTERQGKSKKLLNMKEKGKVLDMLDAGLGPEAVEKFLNISESTVREIKMRH